MTLTLAGAIVGLVGFFGTLILAVYLDFRIQILVECERLPADTPRLFGQVNVPAVDVGLKLGTIFSNRLSSIDGQARVLVPAIRCTIAMVPIGLALYITGS